MLSEINQRQILYYITYMSNLKNRNRLRVIEDKLMFTKGGRNKLGVRD